jgi:hypothetical protein
MEGYEVITSDDHKVGRVVEIRGDNVIVEHGLLRKTRQAVPTPFVHADEAEQVVRLSVSSEIVETSPKIEDGRLDEREIARHYGLAAGDPAPETKGYGELLPDDPARSSEEEALRTGVEPAPEVRARIRSGRDEPGPRGRPIIPPDSHDGP